MKQNLSNFFKKYWIAVAITVVVGIAISAIFLFRSQKEPIPYGFTWQQETPKGVEGFNLLEANKLTVMQTSGGIILQNKENRDDVKLLDPRGKWYYRAKTINDKFRVVTITGETKTADFPNVVSASNDPSFCQDGLCTQSTVYLLMEDRTVVMVEATNRQYVVINP